ncbi:hypothetical protein PP7435_CHR4-0115 [Komagataella phaffii CBS 7435]|uniref:Protein required for respiratory growth and stability of the mitochondrial genome n=2 Tax=Komagataella phaffii TaxID=460519 RepID=C4R930_KOMPG|nr:Protein required for respiratory growth and stability of the mitochondrial genome [Komagataella phaffii GS115]CAH2450485.1 hypothetical protein BQ9382_C4-0625 [Komagataella phaffii CBS 7435]CAY72105.1 Protein required for respiratory growth and stability of the mitochondrial genome [Komagataella phaffii GS115]CCA40291.1 hypothetical protein PP7435_CHR4-0115 [Komagataella phaffii CBS 7435]
MKYSDQLIEEYKELWLTATSNELTREWCQGTLHLSKLYVYLTQDLKYFGDGFRLLGKTISLCRRRQSLVSLGKHVGMLSNSENTYFVDCINDLTEQLLRDGMYNAEELEEISGLTLPAVERYLLFMRSMVESSTITYAEMITVMFVMEQVYLDWSNNGLRSKPDNLHWWFNEWIDIHSGENFESWCQFLKDEVDRCIQELKDANRDDLVARVEEIFRETLELEVEFFKSCYDITDDE